jgi:hypothetical protein
MVALTPIPTLVYNTVITVAPPINLTDINTCIPSEQFIPFVQMVVFKTDAIKLGVVCFIAGMLLEYAFDYIRARWK